MAYIKTSDSIIIKAVLTDEGRKLLSRGQFKVSKFTLGDDEIDYGLINPDLLSNESYAPAVGNIKLFEAYGDEKKNIHFGLNSFDAGIVYVDADPMTDDMGENEASISETSTQLHAKIMHLPILKSNNKLGVAASLSGSTCYMAANDETSEKLSSISGFKFLTPSKLDNCKLVVESGISNISAEHYEDSTWQAEPTPGSRRELILKKFLLDLDYFIYVDDRIIRNVIGITQNSQFKNFQSGETIIKLLAENKLSYPISLQSEFEGYATYVLRGIPNKMYDWPTSPDNARSTAHSVHEGPRGSLLALNVLPIPELKTNSTGQADFRYTKYGSTDKIVFSELPTSKFDYIDTTIYIVGSTTNSSVSIPLRIVRYSGE